MRCAGIWWGVYHPTEAQDVAASEQAKIQTAVAIAKRDLLQKVIAEQSADAPSSGATAAAPATVNHLNIYQEWLKKASDEVKNSGTQPADTHAESMIRFPIHIGSFCR